MKTLMIFFIILIAGLTVSYGQCDNYGVICADGTGTTTVISTTKNVGIGTTSPEAWIDIVGNNTYGQGFGVSATEDIDETRFDGIVNGQLSHTAIWSSFARSWGVNGYVSEVTDLSGIAGYKAQAVGGHFRVDLSNLNATGSCDYVIAGCNARLTGSISTYPSSGVVSALIAEDEIDSDNTFAGYFIGKGYFSGKVGIGTQNFASDPNVKLQVNGRVIVEGSDFMLGPGHGRALVNPSWDINKLHLNYDGDFTEGIYIHPTNTASPELTVSGDIAFSGYLKATSGQKYGLWKLCANESDIYWSSGNVGIGTTNPNENLTIETISTDNPGIALKSSNCPACAGDILFYKDDVLQTLIRMGDGGTFGFEDRSGLNPETRLYIANDGNVGIGVTDPTEKLVVDGKIECEEVEVKNISADYVFEDNYQLKSLAEIEKYINKNNHLPGIAPASETEQGVNLSEFSEKLLEKIEELTLYTIEQQKMIEQLKAEVETLKNNQ